MKNLVILGAGHAGISAALAAYKQRIDQNQEEMISITLINRDDNHGIRPRYYESDLSGTQVPLKPLLDALNIQLVIATVECVCHEEKIIRLNNGCGVSFDVVMLCLGSKLTQPFASAQSSEIYDVDTYQSAQALRAALRKQILQTGQLGKIAILGSGFTGIELACELPLIIKNMVAQHPGVKNIHPNISILAASSPRDRFGESAGEYILTAFRRNNIHTNFAARVERIADGCIYYKPEF